MPTHANLLHGVDLKLRLGMKSHAPLWPPLTGRDPTEGSFNFLSNPSTKRLEVSAASAWKMRDFYRLVGIIGK